MSMFKGGIFSQGGGGGEGSPGANVELQVAEGWIQWRLEDQDPEDTWKNLVEISTLEGADGREVEIRHEGNWIQWKLSGSASWNDLVEVVSGSVIAASEVHVGTEPPTDTSKIWIDTSI